MACSLLVPDNLNFAGAAEDMAHSSLRFGIGRFTTEAEVDYVVQEIVGVVNKLREMRWVPAPLALCWLQSSLFFQPFVGNGPGRD